MHKFESNSADLKVLVNGQTKGPLETKILGLQWDKSNGTFIFDVKDLMKLIVMRPTEREFIQCFSYYIYHPVGFTDLLFRLSFYFSKYVGLKFLGMQLLRMKFY